MNETKTITIPALSNTTNKPISYDVEVQVVAGTGLAYHEAIDRIAYHVTHLATGRIIPCDFLSADEAIDYIERMTQFVDFTTTTPRLLSDEVDVVIWQFLGMFSRGTVATMRGIHFMADVRLNREVSHE